jgi:hypothetical protein
MEIRDRVGIGLSHRPARLHRLAESVPQGIIPVILKSLKYRICCQDGTRWRCRCASRRWRIWRRRVDTTILTWPPCSTYSPLSTGNTIHIFILTGPFTPFAIRYKLISSVVDRHRLDADSGPIFIWMQIRIRIGIKTMTIHMRILRKFYTGWQW